MAKLSKESRRFLESATLRYNSQVDVAEGWLAGRGIGLEFARSSGLGVVIDPLAGHESMYGRLAIPYLTDAGPVNMTFRCIQDHDCKTTEHSKYMFKKGSNTNLYGVQCVSWADDWIVLCEGEIDALTWQMIGIPAIGIPGATKWEPFWLNALEDFSRIYVIQEGDDAGVQFWDRVSHELDNVMRVKMSDKEDTNSSFVKFGEEYLRTRIRAEDLQKLA